MLDALRALGHVLTRDEPFVCLFISRRLQHRGTKHLGQEVDFVRYDIANSAHISSLARSRQLEGYEPEQKMKMGTNY